MDESEMTLGRDWRGEDVTGWLASEKFRGSHVTWDGQTMWTRSGRKVSLPASWRRALPLVALEGEIWAGFGPRNGPAEIAAANAVRYGRFTPAIRFRVFDAPTARGTWPERMAVARRAVVGIAFAECVRHVVIHDRTFLRCLLAHVQHRGGEGLMLRDPDSARYVCGRTDQLLKVKKFRRTFGEWFEDLAFWREADEHTCGLAN